MSEVTLQWKNKDRMLRASGTADYQWVEVTPHEVSNASTIISLSKGVPTRNSNVLVIGDGIDAIEGLASSSDVLADKIRLVYIDPPFNTSADVQCYSDTMDRSMWSSMPGTAFSPSNLISQATRVCGSTWMTANYIGPAWSWTRYSAKMPSLRRLSGKRRQREIHEPPFPTIMTLSWSMPPADPRDGRSRNLLAQDVAHADNKDNYPRGPWVDAPFTAPGYRAAQQYPITVPSGKVLRPPRGRSWYATEPTYCNLLQENRICFQRVKARSPRLKLFSHQLRGLVPFTIWGSSETGTNDDAKRHLMMLFADQSVFDTPKPEELLERIIYIGTNPGELVADLLEEANQAAVAHKMGRRWLLVERNIQTVCDFTLPRLLTVREGNDPGGITGIADWRKRR